jgi:hypothetical protein
MAVSSPPEGAALKEINTDWVSPSDFGTGQGEMEY